ncbi:MAG: arginine--tRNA ligase [Thermoproteota archaeon]|nr:arginine--tRNA ligase [Thermoproteota archaeon]
MLFENIKEEIKNQMKKVLSRYNLNENDVEFEVSEPPLKEYGDFSCNLAFMLSKMLKKNPYEIAKDIVNYILPHFGDKDNNQTLIESVSVEKPGFINFKIDINEFLKLFFSNTKEITKIPECGNLEELILIEHTSVNPNKALHVGHVRNSVIGDCLYRLLRLTKNNVRVLNYVDDSGLQVADIIVAFKYAKIPIEEENKDLPKEKFDHYCGNYVYVKINELYSTRPDLELERKSVLKELENPESEISRFSQQIVKKILIDQLQTCWNLKCHYDVLNFESQIIQSSLWDIVFNILKENQIIQLETTGKNIGCWVFKSQKEGDKVLVRSDSTITYFAKDIPYAMWKLGCVINPFDFEVFSQQWDQTNVFHTKMVKRNDQQSFSSNNRLIDFSKIKKVITVIDFRQERLQSLLFEILSKITIEKTKYSYLGYEPVTLSAHTAELLGLNLENKKSTQMSGRKGIFIEADTALNLLINKSYEEVKKRNIVISEKDANNIAKEIAISAIRYYFIKQDMGKMITFDINDSLSLEGDTGPYIQYSYARGIRIFEKIHNKKDYLNDTDFTNLSLKLSNNEIELIKHLCKFSTTIKESVYNSSPKLVARYLFILSTLFNNFYECSPILKEVEYKKSIRIKILYSALLIMKHCMEIIGITPLEKM